MQLADFDYHLPADLIAKFPAPQRRGSRLLELDGDTAIDRRFAELPAVLREGDVLVFNDTRVLAARLYGKKATGARVEILIERAGAGAHALAMLRVSRTPKAGAEILTRGGHTARILGRAGPFFELEFSADVMTVLEREGSLPLPPYLGRDAQAADEERYQTVYARDPGAVAAPTAGLHFDEAMLEETRAMGVRHAWITLHVGAGTFQSLRHEEVARNRLHAERVVVDEAAVEAIRETRSRNGRVIAVGTTAVRSLEAAAAGGEIRPLTGETTLFIKPGYAFRAVDAMLTNFHLPRSSLLLLVAAFAGRERLLAAYARAVRERYRFFSYGDSMFLTPGADS